MLIQRKSSSGSTASQHKESFAFSLTPATIFRSVTKTYYMWNGGFMDEETTRRFTLILQLEKQRIHENAKTALDELSNKNTNETTGDEGDQAQNMAEQHLSLRFKERERHLLRKIEEALQKIKDGTFGECEDCGDDIGIRRLETRPVATLCIKCKEAEEKRERSYDAQI